MSDNLFGFKNKKERDDFFIAAVVLLFFGWMIMHFGYCSNTKLTDTIAEAPLPAAVSITGEKTVADDADGDGIYDKNDDCPNLAGILDNNGCPADTDGDGIYDSEDKCPKYKGSQANDGCPNDSDKDGVFDRDDNCPELAGTKVNKGCPEDSDGDGVYDINDKCPNKAGTLERNGCPEVKIEEKERVILNTAMRAVQFETGKADLKANSSKILDQIVSILKKYPAAKLRISGHTDNVGEADKNLLLSRSRARSCYDYLVSQGIRTTRLSHAGYGMKRPIDTNDTDQGRRKNRRVEFDLHY